MCPKTSCAAARSTAALKTIKLLYLPLALLVFLHFVKSCYVPEVQRSSETYQRYIPFHNLSFLGPKRAQRDNQVPTPE